MTHLSEVRAAIVKAVPEIATDKITCVCRHNWSYHDVNADYAQYRLREYRRLCDYCICKKYRDNPDHPIRLADVLRAMAVRGNYFVGTDGWFSRYETGHEWVKQDGGLLAVTWPLADDNLDHATPEMIEFLYEILCKGV